MSESYLHVAQAIHGDAFVFEYDEGQKSGFMLVDGGPGQSYTRNGIQYRTTQNLFDLLNHLSTDPNRKSDRQLKYIDTVVVTHDDEDHKNGIADLFRFLLQRPNLPQGSWQTGLNLMNKKPPESPIKKIWYNSQATLIDQYYAAKNPTPKQLEDWVDDLPSGLQVPKPGWFESLLESYSAKFPTEGITFNKEFKRQNVKFTLVYDERKVKGITRKMIQRGPFTFRTLGPSYDDDLMKADLIYALIKTTENEENRVADKSARCNYSGGAHITAGNKASSQDRAIKNKSSIAFVATGPAPSGSTGDTKLLMLGDAVVSQDITAGYYAVMKIAHHGSSHNNYLSSKSSSMDSAHIKVSEGIFKRAFAFFYTVRAKKYVISASPTEGSPNPHIATILGIYFAAVEWTIKVANTPIVDIYLTNTLPFKTMDAFTHFLKDLDKYSYPGDNGPAYVLKSNATDKQTMKRLGFDKFDEVIRIWVLKPNIPFGSIPIYKDDPSANFWDRLTVQDLRKAGGIASIPTTSQAATTSTAVGKLMGGVPPPGPLRKRRGS